jgi:hypothetical protein
MAWNQHWLSSGGRDSMIIQHDVRSANHVVARYKAHEQEVCGLKWNGRLLIYNLLFDHRFLKYVKALVFVTNLLMI